MSCQDAKQDFNERTPSDRAMVRLVQLQAANHQGTFENVIDELRETEAGATAMLTARFGNQYRIEVKPL